MSDKDNHDLEQRIADLTRALHESEARLEHAERTANLYHWSTGPLFSEWEFASENAEDIFGIPVDELVGEVSGFVRHIHPEDREKVRELYGSLDENPRAYELEYRFVRPDGELVYCREKGEPAFGEDGALMRFFGTTQDITRFKAFERDLREGEERYKDAARIARLGHWVYDEVEDHTIYCSDELARIHGVTTDEYLAMVSSTDKDIERVHPEDRRHYGKALRDAQRNASSFDVEYRIIRPDGAIRHIREIGEPVCDETGRLIRSRGALQDVTDQKAAEQAMTEARDELEIRVIERTYELSQTIAEQHRIEERLMEREMMLRRASGMAKMGYWVWDENEDRLITCSNEIPEIMGITKDEYLKAASSLEGEAAWVHPDDRVSYLNTHGSWQEMAAKLGRCVPELDFEYRIVRPDGDIRYVRELVEPTFDEDERFIRSFGIVQDVSERKQAEQTLTQTENNLAKMFRALEQVNEMIVLFDSDDRIVFANRAWRELNTVVEWTTKPGIKFEQHIRALADGGFVPEAIGREEEWIAERLETHRNPPGPFELSRQDGKWVLINESKLEDGSIILVITDITDRKRKEEDLRRSERIARVNARRAEAANLAKTNFLSTMSHEIRTPLNGVLGLAQLLAKSRLDYDQKNKVDTILSSGQTLLAIINDVLDMSRIEAGGMELEEKAFSLRNLVSMIATPFQSLADDKGLVLKVRDKTDSGLVVVGDPVRLRQVLWNLLGNAIKFTDRGSVTMTLDRVESGGPDGLDVKDHLIRFSVADTGVGISQQRIDRIFEAFTQEDSSITRKFGGTGLGLSIVKQLTELMGGAIEASSEINEGSRFDVYIPFHMASKEEMDDLSLRGIQENIRKIEPLNILVAEDNDVNSMIARAFLEKSGHGVRIVENGKLAVAAVRDGWADLVLMDIHMPEMNGIDATRVIRSIPEGENLPIIGLTAEAFSERHAQFVAAGMDAVLTKPFTEQQLTDALAAYRWSRAAADARPEDPSLNADPSISGPATGEQEDNDLPETPGDDLPIGDEDALEDFRQMLNSDDAVAALLVKAEENLLERIDELRLGVNANDVTLIKEAAHSIKGSAGSVFATRISGLSAFIEDNAGNIEAIRSNMAEFEDVAQKTLDWWRVKAG